MISLPNPTKILSAMPTTTQFSGVFLTVENHGCVYTVCTEGELFYAPMCKNGTVNMEEFDFVDFWDSDANVEELEEIQSTLIDMMKRAGLYFTDNYDMKMAIGLTD